MNDDFTIQDADDRVEQELDALRRGFSERLPGRLARMADAWHRLEASGWPEEEERAFHRSIHGLAGTAASLGFHAVGDLVREAEQVVDGLLRVHRTPDAGECARIVDLLMAASEASVRQSDGRTAAPGHGPDSDSAEDPTGALPVIVIDPDGDRARVLATQLRHFGYRVEMVESVESIATACGTLAPGAIVCDLGPADADLRVATHLQRMRDSGEIKAPTLFISARGDIEARLAAVRAGCDAFFTRPVNPGSVVQSLDRLTRRVQTPFRVLVVDDEPDAARYHALVLERGGFLTRVILDPLEVSGQLVEFRPDLILMDVYMPTCSGVELANRDFWPDFTISAQYGRRGGSEPRSMGGIMIGASVPVFSGSRQQPRLEAARALERHATSRASRFVARATSSRPP